MEAPKSFWHTLPKPIKVLAPMEDVTDTVFRRIIATCGRPDVFFTEFASTDGICSPGFKGVAHRLVYTEEERPLVAQIWGNSPEKYLETAKILLELGFDGIDINMGCPVPKIVKKGACSALIDNPNLAKELVFAAKEGAPSLPVSVKTRLGFKSWKTEAWTEHILETEPAALTVHGRIAKELSKKPAKWDEIAKVTQIRDSMNKSTLIIGNGDVRSVSDGLEKAKKYGVDGIMIGRGIFQNPFLFSKKLSATQFHERPANEKLNLLLQHATLHHKTWGERKPYNVMKKYFKIYVSHFPGSAELRAKLVEDTSCLLEAEAVIKHFLEQNSLAE